LPIIDKQQRFWLSDDHVRRLVAALTPTIQHQTERNFALTAEQQIRLSLGYLATGDYYRSVSDAHGVHSSTLSRTLRRFVETVTDTFYADFVDWPRDEMQNCGIQEWFYDKAGMPSVFGCVDGTHVELRNIPRDIEPEFVNRHRTHSINVMLVCGPRLR